MGIACKTFKKILFSNNDMCGGAGMMMYGRNASADGWN